MILSIEGQITIDHEGMTTINPMPELPDAVMAEVMWTETKPLAEVVEAFFKVYGGPVSARWVISALPITIAEHIENLVTYAFGQPGDEIRFDAYSYSSVTPDLCIIEHLKIGGHDLEKLLWKHRESFIAIQFAFAGEHL